MDHIIGLKPVAQMGLDITGPYNSNCTFMHNFTPTDVCIFLVKICKMKGFLYFVRFYIH